MPKKRGVLICHYRGGYGRAWRAWSWISRSRLSGSASTPYRADFICFQAILIALKALKRVSGIKDAQVINHLKASGLDQALPFNFGAPRLEYQRLVH